MSKTIVRIANESALGIGTLAYCEHRAVALYFLAYRAAALDLQLETIVPDLAYRIGNVEYTLCECDVFTIETVACFRHQTNALPPSSRPPGHPAL